jgi:hypothetical protein
MAAGGCAAAPFSDRPLTSYTLSVAVGDLANAASHELARPLRRYAKRSERAVALMVEPIKSTTSYAQMGARAGTSAPCSLNQITQSRSV